MINKRNKSKNKIRNLEKYSLILLISGYVFGIFTGAFFVFSDNQNAEFTNTVITHNNLDIFIYFAVALILKYSGILSGAMCLLPIFLGIHNSTYYCDYIINAENKLIYTTVLTILKDTSVCILLILYITILIVQISLQKNNFKKDIKYLIVYITGVSVINLLEYIFVNIIF